MGIEPPDKLRILQSKIAETLEVLFSVHILDMRYGRHGDLVALVRGKFPNAAVPWIIGSLQVGSTNMATLSFSWRRDSVTGERTCCIQSSRTVCFDDATVLLKDAPSLHYCEPGPFQKVHMQQYCKLAKF